MHTNVTLIELTVRERHAKLLEEAKNERLIRKLNLNRTPLKERITVGAGNLLISMGGKLKRRYEPMTPA